MTTSTTGAPCWYELSTPDPDAAQKFYTAVIGWDVVDSGTPGMDYRLAKVGGVMVAGMMPPPAADVPPSWMIYISVDDCAAAARALAKAGGTVLVAPTDVPGTGSFAVLADPQGAAFGILAPLAADGGAFNQRKSGHGNWHELMSTDPKAAFAFYSKQFGWKASSSMDMGEMGSYDLFSHNGADIGGMVRLSQNMPGPGVSFWLPYFGVDGTDAAVARITAAGGAVMHGPQEVPGGAFIVVGKDPQGAMFALVGPK